MDFVALETIRILQQTDSENEYFVFVSPDSDRCLTESDNLHIIEVSCPTYILWEQFALPRAVAKVKPDLLHCTSNTAPLFCSVPLVLTLHDIIFLEEKQGKNASLYQTLGWYYRRWLVPAIVNRCKRIITVSHTEYDLIIKRFKSAIDKLTVIHNGYSDQYRPLADPYAVTQKYCSDEHFLLFLGNTDPRKNTRRVLQAYDRYRNQSLRQLPLILTGLSEQVLDAILEELQLARLKPHIIRPGYVAGSDLPYLYNSAFAFINVSLREGFGIPVLESMACGTPVVTSNLSSMPEVAGEGGILVDPYNPTAIADQLLLLETDPDHYAQQVAYGLERAKGFSWDKTAQAMRALYESI